MKPLYSFIFSSLFLFMILSVSGQQMPAGISQIFPDSISAASNQAVEQADSSIVKPEWRVTSNKAFWAIVLFIITWIILKYLSSILEQIGERRARYRLLIKGSIPIIRILIWIGMMYFIISSIIAPPWATLFALLASAGIAIGFASQDILKNIFGGVMILFDRPFQVGDKVAIGEHYGEITDIGLRTVRMVTPDDSMVTVPNHEITNTAVSNSNSGESNCQVVAEFYLPVDCDLQTVKKIAGRAAAVSRYVYLKKPIVVLFSNEHEMGNTYIKMRLKAYVLDLRYEFKFKSEMSEAVILELQKREIFSAHALPA